MSNNAHITALFIFKYRTVRCCLIRGFSIDGAVCRPIFPTRYTQTREHMKTILIFSFLCFLIIIENTAAYESQMLGKTIFEAITDCDRENWRTYHHRTWLEFSEDGRTVTLRTNARIPQLESSSQRFNIAIQNFSRLPILMVRIPL